ncbi:MAG: T9SS C-terminal target domain-containing protein [Gemmatimonadetes bacterium]|nr:MAG: T9SS C-terminal target domain-containing protein [Gemmatimonadota bacterium]
MTDLIDSVRVQWLNGAVDVIPSVRVNQRLRVIEPDAYFIRWHGLEQLAETSTGVCWVDYDDDGFTDLFFTNQHGANNRLYHNNGDGTFTPVTSGDLVNDGGNSYGASWGDYDNDGLPDVVVANDGHNVLYHNEGDGNFTRVLDSPIATDGGTSLAAAWSDYNGDGWLDLVIVNYGHNFLYRNYGGTFQRVTDSVIEQDFTYSNACSWGDIDGDRDPDLFVANSGNNSLYINNGDGTFTARRHGNVVSEDGFSLSGSWCDFDRDHDLDLFVTNLEMDNFLFRNNGQGGFSRVTFGDLIDDPGYGYGASWMDANQDGLPDVFVSHGGFVGEQNNTLYLNNGNLTFSAFEESRVDKDQGASLANAWADVDNDGDPDLVVANDGNNFLYHNGGFGHNWFGAELTGTISNHPAIGSKVWIKAGGTWQMQEISAQSGGGYSAQSDRRALFGVGSATVIDSIRVDWSSGVTQYLQNVAVNQYLTISEVYDGSCLPFGVDVRLPELQAEPGANLLIPILLPCDDVAGMDILAFQMEIVFDPAVIHILDYDTHNSLTDAGWTIHINPHTPGRVILNGFSANPLPENGTLIYLRATVTGSEGQVTDLRFVDAFFNERDPICQPISGRVTVGAGGDVFTISGQVQYWQACDGTDAVPDVLLQLSNGLNTTTGEEGLYSLTSPAGVVTLSASKTGDNSGISTFDAARVAQYSAGSYDFNECQILAADVTQNGSINPFDAARIAQFAAGIEQSSVAGEWMFTPERYHYEPLQMDMPGQNFSAVLMGEVTGNWSPTFRMKNNEFGVQNQNVRIKFSNHQLQQVDPVENVIAFQFLIAGEDDLQVDLAETVPADWQLVTHRRGPVLWFVGAFGITPLQDGALLNLSESVNLSSLQLISGQINEQPVTVIPEVALPQHVALYPAYPNPFNPRTTIRFEVPQSMNVTLAVYDMSGQLVQTLMSGIVDAGSYSVQWQGDDRTGHKVSSGIYLYRLETEQQQFVRRMILLR